MLPQLPVAPAAPIRVLLVDDHRSVLWGLRKLIEAAAPQFQLAEAASCRRDALRAFAEHRPDVVVLDLDLGEDNGVDLIGELRTLAEVNVLVLTGARDAETRERAVLAGARGLVHKSEPAEVILDAIASVHAGELWLDSPTIAKLFRRLSGARRDEPSAAANGTLTPAERRVIRAVLQHKGAPNKVIASALNISEHTLRNHLASIYDKLGVHHRLDLVLYAMEHRLGEPGL
jgi:two-component system, NarL family, nitrate/nitrite response regulator NarL